jgi:hypothetical protein
MERVERQSMSAKWRSIVIVALLLAAAGEFTVRGPLRALREPAWNDFLSPYIQARAWEHGKDPYSTRSVISLWPSGNRRPTWVEPESASGVLEARRGIPSPYPLSTLVVISPFTLFPWTIALSVWIAVSVLSVVLSAFAMLSICACRIGDLRSQLFLIALFALAPLHTGLGTANPAILAVSLTVLTVWAAQRDKKIAAGLLLALAICVKPTVAGGLLLYYLIRRQWKVAGVACGIVAIVAVLGVSRLAFAGAPWLASYIESTRRMFSTGSLDDFTGADAIRLNMVNAQVLFYAVLRSAPLADHLAKLLGAGFLGCWLWLSHQRRTASGLLEISAISVLSLIPLYHRFYDASLLIWPLAWVLLRVHKRSTIFLVLLAIAPFLVPGAVLLSEAAGRLPSTITSSWWWNTLLLPHEVWALILLTVLLLYWMARGACAGTPEKSLEVHQGSSVVRPGSAFSELPSS